MSRWTASRPGFPLWADADDLERSVIAARGYPWQPADEIRRLQDSIEVRRRTVAAMLWQAAHDRGPGAHATVGLLRQLAAREQAALEQEIAELRAWEVATGVAGWEVEMGELSKLGLEELLARVPERYELIATHSKLKGRRWYAGWWTDDEQASEGCADARQDAIRAATVLLLGEAPETGPALRGDGWQIVPGQEPPGLTCEQYAEIYLGGEW